MNDSGVEDGASVIGRARIGKGSVIMGRSIVRGPSIAGEGRMIGPNAYIGLYNAMGDRCQVSTAEVDNSIVMDDTVINVERKFIRSLIGKGSKIVSSASLIPKGERLVVRENTTIYL